MKEHPPSCATKASRTCINWREGFIGTWTPSPMTGDTGKCSVKERSSYCAEALFLYVIYRCFEKGGVTSHSLSLCLFYSLSLTHFLSHPFSFHLSIYLSWLRVGKNYTFDKRFSHGAKESVCVSSCVFCKLPWDRYQAQKTCCKYVRYDMT